MSMFQAIIDSYGEKIGPMAREVGVTAEAYAQRILATLDCIHQELRIANMGNLDSVPVVRNWTSDTTTPYVVGTLTNSEEWELQAIAGNGAATIVTIRQDGALRYVGAMGSTNGLQNPRVILRGPGEVVAAATVTGVEMYLQFVQRDRASDFRKKTNRTGFVNPVDGDRLGLAANSRHGGRDFHNVHGGGQ